MKQILIVVDMQTDFVDGALGTAEACAMLPHAADYIRKCKGDIIVTLDTHMPDYLDTAEGKQLPVPHCIKDTPGWQLHPAIADALTDKPITIVEKPTFGSVQLPDIVRTLAQGQPFALTLLGLCTDICVVSNALLLKAHFPETNITVLADCCAGVTPESHAAALTTMRMCQIQVANA